MTSDVVFYLSPVVCGQFSANIKTVVDRWLPNMLPFFDTRPDGSTVHPPRYVDYPRQIVVGCAEDLTDEDAQLFWDITKKHRRNIDVLIWKDDAGLAAALDGISLERMAGFQL
jgi:hypothetical protein